MTGAVLALPLPTPARRRAVYRKKCYASFRQAASSTTEEPNDEGVGDRRRRVYRLGGVPAVCRRAGHGRAQCRQIDLCRQSRLAQADRERPGLRVSPRRYRATARRLPRSSDPLRPTQSFISRPKRMSTDRSTARANSSGPISRALTCCSRRRSNTGARCRPSGRGAFAFITSRPMRCSARSDRTASSARRAATSPTRPMPPPRRPRTIWCGPGTRPSGCRP